MNNLASDFKKPIIISTHPRTRKKIQKENVKFDNLIKLIKPLGFLDYVKLQISSSCVLSDSGTITEEDINLNFNTINIRENQKGLKAWKKLL